MFKTVSVSKQLKNKYLKNKNHLQTGVRQADPQQLQVRAIHTPARGRPQAHGEQEQGENRVVVLIEILLQRFLAQGKPLSCDRQASEQQEAQDQHLTCHVIVIN